MLSLTKNEARVIDFLLRNFSEKYSINQVGRNLGISPKGAYYILKKLEENRLVKAERIGNAIYYHLNFNEETAVKIAELVLMQNKTYSKEFEPLKKYSTCCINMDKDIILIFDKKDHRNLQDRIRDMKLKQQALHTKKELIRRIRRRDKSVINAIKRGEVLWGEDLLVEAIKDGSE